MTSLLIENAAILTLDAAERFIEAGHLLVQDGRIAAVAPGAYLGPADRRIDGAGRLVTPGLINAHTHSQSSTLAGFADGVSHPAFMWLTQAHTARRSAAEIRLAVLLCAWAMLSTGTTAAIDHFPGQRFSAADLDAVLGAWAETGMRVALGMRFFDAEFADIAPDGIAPALQARMAAVPLLQPQGLDDLRGLMSDAVGRWHNRGLLQVWPAPSNPDRCTDAALLFCAELAERHDLGIHTHLLETQLQARQAVARHGRSSVARLVELGVLSDRWSCAHCLWLTAADRALMAEAGAIAVLNPESNARVGTGTADVAALREAGVRLALGTDGAGANDNQVMQEAMRSAANLGRAGTPRPTWTRARTALAMATTGGAAALRLPGLGTLRVGAPADLVMYRLDTPAWTPLNDPVTQLVHAETGSSVDMVIVAGEILLEKGQPTRFDTAALAAEIRDMQRSLARRNADLFDVAGKVAALFG